VIDDGTMSGQAINDIVKEIGLSLKPREKCKDEVSRYFDEWERIVALSYCYGFVHSPRRYV
jgi:hypothetical protein